MKYKLSDICEFAKGKVEVASLTRKNYISTENMMPNKGGVNVATALPSTAQTQQYLSGDILVSNIRPYFKKIWHATRNGGCSNDVLVFRAKEGVSPEFLYYVLADDTFFDYATATSKGTKMPRGDKKSIMEYGITDFDLPTQQKIGSVLRALDDKIELNQKINKNLEEQAQAIFRAEFTDNPLANSYPMKPLAELCTVVTKGTTPTTIGRSFVSSGVNFIKAECILDDHSIDIIRLSHIDEETNAVLKRSVICTGDIIFTIAGTLGRFALVDDSILPANTNQAVAIIRPDTKKISTEYLYSFFIGNWHNDYYTKRIQQAVQANLSLTTIKSLPIPMLPETEMTEYISLISPIFKLIKANEVENQKLATMRDTLLPKLMSGEIDVSDIQL